MFDISAFRFELPRASWIAELPWDFFLFARLNEARFCGGRYGISIDFGLEAVEKKNICGARFKSKFIDLTMKPRLDRVMVTRDRPFCKTRDAGVLVVCTSRISDAACFEHAIASAAKRLRSNVRRSKS